MKKTGAREGAAARDVAASLGLTQKANTESELTPSLASQRAAGVGE